MMDVEGPLLEHLHRHLGAPKKRYDTLADGRKMETAVLVFSDRPTKGATTFVTLGLSRCPFTLQNGHAARQELVFSLWDRYLDRDVPGLLYGVASEVLKRDAALIRGQVLGPGAPIFEGASVNAIYAAPPAYFSESFDFFAATVPGTMLVGLVPVTTHEAAVISQMGWSRFEDLLETQNPDLLDIQRQGVMFAGS